MSEEVKTFSPTREKIYEIIFESDTALGKYFDIALLIFILGSVITVIMESVDYWHDNYLHIFLILEWFFTIFFTIEYILRLYCVHRPWKYATSFFGVIDLLAVIPTYLMFFLTGAQSLIVIRSLRLLRVFRIFKIGTYMEHGALIVESMRASRGKIAVFLYFVILMVVIIGSSMYVVEGDINDQFDSIPTSIYWAIVTLTTVGYGDITPVTNFGKLLSAIVMITGYAVIAVPTGIISANLVRKNFKVNGQACPHCSLEGHDNNAVHCKFCGEKLLH
ncbi:MAG: ion transporter [Saprospiraceae bacterium]|nr:ion transporter [Saprospiraceae bacterium]